MKISESKIEQFVRSPESLSNAEKLQIEDAIKNDSMLMDYHSWFVEFYREFRDYTHPNNTPSFLHLKPLILDHVSKSGFTVLAALTKRTTRSGVEHVCSLSDSSNRGLLRILKNHDINKYQVQFIHAGLDSESYVHLVFDRLAIRQFVKTGAFTTLEFRFENEINQLDFEQCRVQLPICTVKSVKRKRASLTLDAEIQVKISQTTNREYIGLVTQGDIFKTAVLQLAQLSEHKLLDSITQDSQLQIFEMD